MAVRHFLQMPRHAAMLLIIAAVPAGFSGGCVPARENPGPLQGQGAPRSPSPRGTAAPPAATENAIVRVAAPEPGATITSPVTVAGEARTFEANVQIRVRDGDGAELAHTFTTALTPDMGVFGPFSAPVRYLEPGASRGFVEVFESSAKDGSEINVIRIPVLFGAQEWTSVQVFFSPATVGNDCSETVAISRRIPRTEAIGRAALEELLAGPTDQERAGFGVTTTIPSGVTVRSFAIREGVAYADFDRTMETAGSCRVTAIRASVTRTLLQFPTVRSVLISVAGNVEEALQP